MNTLRNLVLSLCIGSIVAILVNMKIATSYKFSASALALGFFVFSSLFALKPIKAKKRLAFKTLGKPKVLAEGLERAV